MLADLPEHLLHSVCYHLDGASLARLGQASLTLKTVAQSAAEQLLASRCHHAGNWRMCARVGEAPAYQLFVLEELLPATQQVVSTATAHALVVSAGGKLVAFGDDSLRQLGLGGSDAPTQESVWGRLKSMHSTAQPVRYLDDRPVMSVAAGQAHSCCIALLSDGTPALFTWGSCSASRGATGHEPPEFQESWPPGFVIPAPRLLRKHVALVAAGHLHTACISVQGEVFTWGRGAHGRLGHGDDEDRPRPSLVETLPGRTIALDCGMDTTAVVTHDGRLLVAGTMYVDGQFDSFHDPTLIRFPESAAAVRQVSCGQRHFAAIDAAGALYTWGYGAGGRLGHGSDVSVGAPRQLRGMGHQEVDPQGRRTMSSRVTAVSCGSDFTAAICKGSLWSWGANTSGSLGHNDCHRRTVPTRVCMDHLSDGVAAATVVAVCCGRDSCVTVLASGELVSFGNGDKGQSGRPNAGSWRPGVVGDVECAAM
jgi:alpha-tubulin suppressor-like RCC1 family protein